MPKIKCDLPNATSPINGLEFEPHEKGGLVSVEEMSDERAAYFTSIPGYSIADDSEPRRQRAPRAKKGGQAYDADPPPPPADTEVNTPPPAADGDGKPNTADGKDADGEPKE